MAFQNLSQGWLAIVLITGYRVQFGESSMVLFSIKVFPPDTHIGKLTGTLILRWPFAEAFSSFLLDDLQEEAQPGLLTILKLLKQDSQREFSLL